MEGIDLNYAALAACVLNIKLTRTRALEIMGVAAECITKKMLADDFVIKKTEKENIYRLYNIENMTMKQIGEVYGVGQGTINKFMVKNAMTTRSRGVRKGVKI
jgi:DNA-directed RNA polymerase specialized sigma subunit